MTLIEGIGDEVTQFFIGLIIVIVVTFAWWTTNITEQRQFHTVLLLDRRRHHRFRRRLTNHTHTVTITEGTSTSETAGEEIENSQTTATDMNKPPEPSTSRTDGDERIEQEQDEQNRIVETMDAELCMVRQRRLAFYTKNDESAPQTSTTENCKTDTTSSTTVEENKNEENDKQHNSTPNPSDIKIRLKYINDDLKLVDGNLKELLGHFKNRHFHEEISSNKLVRLIFNGQVLHQDSKTLEACGLFDNCVVHCLIHQKRPSPNEEQSSENRTDNSNSSRNRNGPSNNNQGREWDLGNFLFASLTLTLLSAWYFRYLYAHLYTVTATVGLILITGIFTIVLLGFYFPDQEHIPTQRPENAQSET